MTDVGFLFSLMGVVVLICIIVVITVASTITSAVAAVVDDEDGEEEQNMGFGQARIFVPVLSLIEYFLTNESLVSMILRNIINKGDEKEEYITRLPREKYPLAERYFEDRLMEGSF